MQVKDLIKKKRDGENLSDSEIQFLIKQYHKGEIQDYHMAAFLMACYLRGLSEEETYSLTRHMLDSGLRLDLSEMDSPVIGKHSTGGVGDKVSLVLAPLVAAAGVVVPMIAGRGLGHTGGTIDKLESIPGFNTSLDIVSFRDILWEVGTAITAQTQDIAPVDRRLYQLRDATATVECQGLIISSIMSKKLAEGLNGLVLDIKVGKGAFMKQLSEAEQLAEKMVKLGNSFGVKTVAVITDMDEPLGRAVGNALEVRECINMLKGQVEEDLEEVVLVLGAWMLYIAEEMLEDSEEMGTFVLKTESVDESKLQQKIVRLKELLDSGDAFKKFVEVIEAQGGHPEVVASPGLLPVAEHILPIDSETTGYVHSIDAEKIGRACMLLGAGRNSLDEPVDHAVGVVIHKKSGTKVEKSEPLAVVHYNDDRELDSAVKLVRDAFKVSESPPQKRQIIKKIIL